MKFAKLILASGVLALVMSPMVQADVIWDWSFNNTSGQFTTDGNDTLAGTFNLTDWSLTATDTGATIGSLLGGEYLADGFSTFPPYSMEWDGNSPTKWDSAGSNSFDWWVFKDVAAFNSFLFFGWQTGNVNTVDQATYWADGSSSIPSFHLNVGPSQSVPEPTTLLLLSMGLAGLVVSRKRTQL